MIEERHSSVLAWRKATLWVLAVLCLLELLQKDLVLNAMWLFCTAGVVPWRKQPLAPDTVLLILAGFVGLIILVTAMRLIIKMVRRRRESMPAQNTQRLLANSPTEPVEKNTESDVVAQPQESILIKTAATRPALPHFPVVITTKQTTTSFSIMPLLRVVAYGVAYIVWIMHFLEAITRIAVHWSVKVTVVFARWLMPRLWQFDAWLERQTHKHFAAARKKAKKHQKLQDLALFGRESRYAITSRITVVRSAKNEQ